MTVLICYILLWISDNRSFDTFNKIKEQKKLAENAYLKKDYTLASNLYHQISYGSLFSDPGARMNLANAYFENKQFTKAAKQYKLLTQVKGNRIATRANNQLGLIAIQRNDSSAALNYFKTALKIYPNNKIAKVNYIYLKDNYTGFDEMNSELAITKDKSTTIVEQQAQLDSIQNQIEEVSEEAKKEKFLKSLRSINMTEEQARAILDAMKANESQYIFQLRRAQYGTQENNSKKIEW